MKVLTFVVKIFPETDDTVPLYDLQIDGETLPENTQRTLSDIAERFKDTLDEHTTQQGVFVRIWYGNITIRSRCLIKQGRIVEQDFVDIEGLNDLYQQYVEFEGTEWEVVFDEQGNGSLVGY